MARAAARWDLEQQVTVGQLVAILSIRFRADVAEIGERIGATPHNRDVTVGVGRAETPAQSERQRSHRGRDVTALKGAREVVFPPKLVELQNSRGGSSSGYSHKITSLWQHRTE